MDLIESVYKVIETYHLSELKYLIDIIILFAFLGLFYSYVLLPVYNVILLPAYKLGSLIHVTCGDVSAIKKELQTNGGKSLKDTVLALREDFDALLNLEVDNVNMQKAILTFLGLEDTCRGIAFYKVDNSGSCDFVTSKWSDLTGLTEEQSLGFGWLNSIHPESREKVTDEFLQSIKHGKQLCLTYNVYNAISRATISVDAYALPIKNRAIVTGYIVAVKHTTARCYEEHKLSPPVTLP